MLIDQYGNTASVIGKKVIFYGASTRNKRAIDELHIHENVLFFIDKDKSKHGTKMDGYEVHDTNELQKYKDAVVITVLVKFAEEIIEAVKKHCENSIYFFIPCEYELQLMYNHNKNVLAQEHRYKYVHVFPDDIFVNTFAEMIKKYFRQEEHLIILDCCVGKKEYGVYDYALTCPNIVFLGDMYPECRAFDEKWKCDLTRNTLLTLCSNADRVLLHSAFWGRRGFSYVQNMVREFAERISWIVWGADALVPSNCEIAQQILTRVNKIYCSKKGTAVVKKNLNMTAIPSDVSYAYLIQVGENVQKEGEEINILLGHSGDVAGNQSLGLELLKKYRNENIKIYAPLAYGDSSYIQSVIDKGKALFGGKFIPLTKFMNTSLYYEFLKKIDVAVFPMSRKMAGTTIAYLNLLGKKIYVNKTLTESFGEVKLNNVEEIKDLSLEAFIHNSNNKSKVNIDEHNKKIVENWKKIMQC